MTDPLYIPAPDNTGTTTLRRFTYQEKIAARYVIAMLGDGGGVLHVTGEHIEDVTVATAHPAGLPAEQWNFMQVKTKDDRAPWSLSDVIAKGSLKSLWRTYQAVRGHGLDYVLTSALEGHLDPADSALTALTHGKGADHPDCLSRVSKHLKADTDKIRDYLSLVRVMPLPRREHVDDKSLAGLAELAPQVTTGELRAVYVELMNRVHDAMQGEAGPGWKKKLGVESPSEALLRKRLTAASVHDLAQRLRRPDHVLLAAYSDRLDVVETSLVRKLRRGGASQGTIQEAQFLRSQADEQRLGEVALGVWPADSRVEQDLDTRLRFTATRVTRRHQERAHRPADFIWDDLLQEITSTAGDIDRRPLYAKDPLLLMGRACSVSDECQFGWGVASGEV
ncbi:dsDNA nuclease domain-containing protein [Streptomyces sp. NPDC051079]|uniref:dsDNA nuclease domain-containing protein n=1 Tax=Streptomyces sp. NPDC051079 TaxID=3155043 RepID=UPI00344C2D28